MAIIDTNADPDLIDFPIAANDDAIKSIRVITREIADAIYSAKHGASVSEMAGEEAGEGEEKPEEQTSAPVENTTTDTHVDETTEDK